MPENHPTLCRYRRKGGSYVVALNSAGLLKLYMLTLSHPDCYQCNIVVLFFIHCVNLHIIDDGTQTFSIGISSEMLESTSFSRPDSWCITPLALHGSVVAINRNGLSDSKSIVWFRRWYVGFGLCQSQPIDNRHRRFQLHAAHVQH